MLKNSSLRVSLVDENDNSRSKNVWLKDYEVRPFGYHDLKKNNKKIPFSGAVTLNHAILDDSADFTTASDVRHTAQFTLKSNSTNSSYALMYGGWFPPGFTSMENPIYLLDTCTYNDIRHYCKSGDGGWADLDYVENFLEPECNINILPVLLEGNNRRIPDDFEILQHYKEVMKHLHSVLPNARFHPTGYQAILAVKNFINEPAIDIRKESLFLKDIWHHLRSPVAKKRLPSVLKEIRFYADLHQVGSASLTFLAVLSALSCGQSNNPARKIFKAGGEFDAEEAYNALSDLRSLKILCIAIAGLPAENPVFCTSDKNLALFWVGLDLKNIRTDGNKLSYDITFSDILFPGLDISIIK